MTTCTTEELLQLHMAPPSPTCSKCGIERSEADRAKGGHLCPHCNQVTFQRLMICLDAHVALQKAKARVAQTEECLHAPIEPPAEVSEQQPPKPDVQIATTRDGTPILETYCPDDGTPASISVEHWQEEIICDIMPGLNRPQPGPVLNLVVDGDALTLTLAQFGKLREFVTSGIVEQLVQIAYERKLVQQW